MTETTSTLWIRYGDDLGKAEYRQLLESDTYALFCQDRYWRNIDRGLVEISEMEYSYLSNVDRFLQRGADHWRRQMLVSLTLLLSRETVNGLEDRPDLLAVEERLEGAEREVIFESPLYKAIVAERRRRIEDPQILETLPTKEERDTYYALVEEWPGEPADAAIISRDHTGLKYETTTRK